MTGRCVHGRLDTVTVSLIVVSVTACASILAREATYGIGLATDTIFYIDTARNILAGNGFAMTWGGDYVHWPPLYPMLLAGAGLSLFDPYDVAGPFNAIVLALIVLSVGMHMRNRVKSGFLAVWLALSIALSTTLAKSTSYALSEPVFILFALISLMQFVKFLDTNRRRYLVYSAAFAAAACSTRYIGVTITVFAVLMLALRYKAPIFDKVKCALLYAFVSLTPVCLWILRNVSIGKAPMGERDYRDFHLFDIIMELPPHIPVKFAIIAGLYAALRRLSGGGPATNLRQWNSFLVFLFFSVCYVVVLVLLLSMETVGHGVQPRYLAPVYVPVLSCIVFLVDRIFLHEREKNVLGHVFPAWRAGTITGFKAVVCASMIGFSAHRLTVNLDEIAYANTEGTGGFAKRRWAESEVIRFVRALPAAPEAMIGNTVWPLYIHADVRLPLRRLPAGLEDARSLIDRAQDGVLVIWIHDWVADPTLNYGAAELAGLADLEIAAELADGIVFRIAGERRDAGRAANPPPR